MIFLVVVFPVYKLFSRRHRRKSAFLTATAALHDAQGA